MVYACTRHIAVARAPRELGRLLRAFKSAAFSSIGRWAVDFSCLLTELARADKRHATFDASFLSGRNYTDLAWLARAGAPVDNKRQRLRRAMPPLSANSSKADLRSSTHYHAAPALARAAARYVSGD